MPFPRTEAAKILHEVAEATSCGSLPSNVSPFLLGRAICRTIMNNVVNNDGNGEGSEDAIVGEFLRGFFNRPK